MSIVRLVIEAIPVLNRPIKDPSIRTCACRTQVLGGFSSRSLAEDSIRHRQNELVVTSKIAIYITLHKPHQIDMYGRFWEIVEIELDRIEQLL